MVLTYGVWEVTGNSTPARWARICSAASSRRTRGPPRVKSTSSSESSQSEVSTVSRSGSARVGSAGSTCPDASCAGRVGSVVLNAIVASYGHLVLGLGHRLGPDAGCHAHAAVCVGMLGEAPCPRVRQRGHGTHQITFHRALSTSRSPPNAQRPLPKCRPHY